MKDNYDYSGIYKITNIENNKFYIGSAKNIKHRWRVHLTHFKHNKHCNIYMQRTYDKYGVASLLFELIEKVDDLSLLIEREQYYMDTLKPEYNLSPTAGSNLGYKFTAKQRANAAGVKKINQYSLDGKYIKTFLNMGFAAESVNCDVARISDACTGKTYKCEGYLWKYSKDITTEDIEALPESYGIMKAVNQFDLEGKYIKTFPSVKSASESVSSRSQSISDACKGVDGNGYKVYARFGFQWRYDSGDHSDIEKASRKKGKLVTQYALSGRYIKSYASLVEAAKAVKVGVKNIRNATRINGSSAGFQWRADTPEPDGIGEYEKSSKVYGGKINQYDLDGEYIKTFESISEASEILGIHCANIIRSINTDGCRAASFLWKKNKNNYDNIKKYVNSQRTVVKQFTLAGKYVATYESAEEAGRVNNCNASNILNVAYGRKNKSCGGFVWKV